MAALSGPGGPGRAPGWLPALLLGLLLAAPSQADLYRCVEANGELVFTDSPANCRGATRHDASGDLQTVESPAPPEPGPAAAPPAHRSDEHLRQEKAVWQQKKRTAERDLARAEERSEELRRYVAACNRGVKIIGRDDTGMKYTVPCERVREEHAENEAQLAPLRKYLAEGLRRECREAGCLPGWIR